MDNEIKSYIIQLARDIIYEMDYDEAEEGTTDRDFIDAICNAIRDNDEEALVILECNIEDEEY